MVVSSIAMQKSKYTVDELRLCAIAMTPFAVTLQKICRQYDLFDISLQTLKRDEGIASKWSCQSWAEVRNM